MQNSNEIITSTKPNINLLHNPVTFFSSDNEKIFKLFGFKDTGATVMC